MRWGKGKGVGLLLLAVWAGTSHATGTGPTQGQSSYPYATEVRHAARRHGVEEALVRAVIQAESGFDTQALSPKGAVGLMQLMLPTARQYAPRATAGLLRRDPALNIDIGTHHLKTLTRQVDKRYPQTDAGQKVRLVAAAYNAGWSRIVAAGGQVPTIAETRTYVGRVERNYHKYGGASAIGPEPALLPRPRLDPMWERYKLVWGLGALLALQAVCGWCRLMGMRRRALRGLLPIIPSARRIS
jgi:hypothetical protein